MATVTKRGFVDQLQSKAIDVPTAVADGQVKQAVQQGGGNVADLAKADLDRDGKIKGAGEAEALFRQLDRMDSDGSAASITNANAAAAANRLLGLATPTTTTTTGQPPLSFGQKLSDGGAKSLESRMKGHLEAIDKTGVGTLFGDHSFFKDMSLEEKRTWVEENKKPGTNPPMPKESSCIAWAMENVGAAYYAAGKGQRWEEIRRTVAANGSKGTDLAKELKKDGWEAVYWNPDAKHPSDGLAEHSFSASQVAKGKPYYGVKVDHQVINYRPTEGAGTPQDDSGIAKLEKVPFFFGLAKGGMHTFVGRAGKVNEFHWSEMPNSKEAIEETPLKNWGWNSGLIMVPPGAWPR